MKSLAAVVCVLFAGLGAGCNAGGGSIISQAGSGGTSSNGGSTPTTTGQAGTTGTSTGKGGIDIDMTGAAGTQGSAGTVGSGGTGTAGTSGDTSGTGGSASAGTTGSGGKPNTGTAGTGAGGTTGSAGTTGTGGATAGGLKSGPFKIIMLTTTLEFRHDSIPTCLKLLQDLGKAGAPERATITGLAADSTWTVDQIGDDPKKAGYFSEVTADNLKNYELFYSNNPTGKVFTMAPDGANKKQIFQDYWNNGGSWAGQHSATDFENSSAWPWFQANIDGGWFHDHDSPTTSGTINWEATYVNHPILKGLQTPWTTTDEWYEMQPVDISAVKGFQVIAKVTVSNGKFPASEATRAAVWITENPKGGRSFYTIRGHDPKVYAETEFRQLMLRGILWAVHRLPGGN